MNSNKFIKAKIKELLKIIPYLEIYHENDKFSESHFLKVLPLEDFNSNELYIEFEKNLNIEFFKKYPYELITFLSEDDEYEMQSPKKYTLPSGRTSNIPQKYTIEHDQIFINNEIDNSLFDYMAQIPSSINFSAFFNVSKFRNTYEEILTQHKNTNKNVSVSVSTAKSTMLDLDCSDISTNNNEDYSLAA